MTTIPVSSIKAAIVFAAGNLPSVDPSEARIELVFSGLKIEARINRKAAARLSVHHGGAVLQGRLIAGPNNGLVLAEAGFTWLEPRPSPSGAQAGQGATDHATTTEPGTEAR